MFRCNIPVIVMGETGCGKTRLVKFLCALQTPRRKDINTMVLVKVRMTSFHDLSCVLVVIVKSGDLDQDKKTSEEKN